MTLYDMR